jgi:hypothetical protein
MIQRFRQVSSVSIRSLSIALLLATSLAGCSTDEKESVSKTPSSQALLSLEDTCTAVRDSNANYDADIRQVLDGVDIDAVKLDTALDMARFFSKANARQAERLIALTSKSHPSLRDQISLVAEFQGSKVAILEANDGLTPFKFETASQEIVLACSFEAFSIRSLL